MKELEDLRREIDEIDRELMRLLEKRFQVVESVARIKKGGGMRIDDAAREKEVISNCKAAAKNLNPRFVEKLMRLILAQSKKVQRKK